MTAVDFTRWAANDRLEFLFGGRTVVVRPPSVDEMKIVIAAAVRFEIASGWVQAEMPADMQAMLDALGPDDHPALGDSYAELASIVDEETLKRVTAYAVFFWARDQDYADAVAQHLWTDPSERTPVAEVGSPKARLRERLRSGRRMASASRTRTDGSTTTTPSRSI